MGSKNKSPDTKISNQTQIHGDIKISGSLLIDGHVTGNIIADKESGANVLISDKGSVTGEIRAPYVLINGKVAMAQLELDKKAVIIGDVHYAIMEMVMGAQVNGRLVHNDNINESSNVIESDFSKNKSKPKSVETVS